jgi:DNA-binding Lrp family transcriptional regulator
MSERTRSGAEPARRPATLDDTDRGLVELLRGDGRASVRALADELHISRATAYARLDRLQRDGVITGYAARVDPERYGYGISAYVYLKISQHSWKAVRRRVQQDTTGHRGHKHDPLYKIRGLLRHGAEHLTPRQHSRLETGLRLGDPNGEVDLAWQCYQRLRSAYHATLSVEGRRRLVALIAASADDWDRYESLHWHTAWTWVKSHPAHPDAAMLAGAVEAGKRRYLELEREYLGWAIFVCRIA